ncbi:MAG: ABC transporter substrate-binding protein [Clostridia bacterium]
MRKLIALLLALMLCFSALPVFAEAANTPANDAADDTQTNGTAENGTAFTPLSPTEIALLGRPVSDVPTHITVGNTTKVSGNFFTGMWSNNTSDIDVRTLLHGYSTVVWNSQVEFITDPMVVESLTTSASRGNTVYTIKLWDDLTYCDGKTAITASDYVFSLLLCASPQVAELGGTATQFAHILGYEEYHSGESELFSGVQLIDEYTFSITVKKTFEPFFFEMSYVQVVPYPLEVLAPYCTVLDEGKGAFFGSVDPEATEVPFTTEVLAETIFNEKTGYMYEPKLTSGPYKLLAYDRETGRVEFELNPYYKGNYEGVKPIIDTLSLVPVLPETMIAQLKNREVDLLNKCVDQSVILEGMGLVNNDFAMTNYARIGYGYCAFACEKGPQQFQAVRQAIAYSFDADAFIQELLGTFAIPADGYYGLGQWMTLAAMGSIRPEGVEGKEAAKWDKLTLEELNHYAPDADTALALLTRDGWTLNEQGKRFDPAVDKVRYKKVKGELMRLSMLFAKTANNPGAQLVADQLTQTLPPLGFEFIVQEVPFSEMLSDYYREDGTRKYDMNFMATNFNSVFDPYYTFITDETVEGAVNTSGINDQKLMKLAWDMHKTEPMDFLGYEKKWLNFQKRFNELLPTMPIYTNIYFDFHTDWLQNYSPNSQYSWPVAILYAYYAEPAAPPEQTATDAGMGEEEVIILE